MRTENMQACVDYVKCYCSGNSDDQRMEIMISAVENPDRFNFNDDSIKFWIEFARKQMEYGREAVTELLTKAPELMNDEIIGMAVKSIISGGGYGQRLLKLFLNNK